MARSLDKREISLFLCGSAGSGGSGGLQVPAVCKFRRLLFPTFVLPPQQNTFRGIINACYAWPIFTKVTGTDGT